MALSPMLGEGDTPITRRGVEAVATYYAGALQIDNTPATKYDRGRG